MRLFALPGSDILGRAVAQAAGIELDPVEEREFEDGEHKSRPLVSVRGEDVYVLHSLASGGGQSGADRLMRLLFFIAACRDHGAARVTAVVPYLAFSRKDQRTQPRDPVNTRYVAELFEAVGTGGIVTLEVHNPAAYENAFRIPAINLDLRNAFAARIAALAAGRHAVIVSPDAGGMRRAQRLRETVAAAGGHVSLAMMEKHRSGGTVTGELFAGLVNGAEVFIVDDMIATGGTMLRAAEACRDRGASSVTALATHGLFGPGSEGLLASPAFDRIVVSDSVTPPDAGPMGAGKVERISCAPLLAETIGRLHGGGSIQRLLAPRR